MSSENSRCHLLKNALPLGAGEGASEEAEAEDDDGSEEAIRADKSTRRTRLARVHARRVPVGPSERIRVIDSFRSFSLYVHRVCICAQSMSYARITELAIHQEGHPVRTQA